MLNRRTVRTLAVLFALPASLGLAGCDDDPSGPQRAYRLYVQSGDDQLAGFGQFLESPLQVLVENSATGDPATGVTVNWVIVDGSGAQLSAESSITNASGVASTALQLGESDETYRVRATVAGLVGPAATFDATAVAPAHIDSVAPAQADAGDTILVHGSGFAPAAEDNSVLIAGFRATVLEATATQLRAIVPVCVPTRSAELRVDLGTVQSNAATLEVTGPGAAGTQMDIGEVLHLDAAASACLRLAPAPGAQYLVLLQNATTSSGRELQWRMTGAAEAPFAVGDRPQPSFFGYTSRTVESAASPRTLQEALDFQLRELEGAAAARSRVETGSAGRSMQQAAPPEIGDSREFWVFRRAGEYERVTAVVRHVSQHAILYEDVDAPEGGFEAGDFEQFGAVFDDPIYETMTTTYGEPSDVDANERVIILFTPVVNLMTPAGSGMSFIAGFFFGIDLLEGQSRGNDAEVFYTLVPDPDAQFGNVRTFEQILRGVTPVMAHEFQHMIHFNQRVLLRDGQVEQTWLSEGLAHTAEELVADAYTALGDVDRAFDFRLQNYLRAEQYLDNTAAVSPIGPAVPLAVRGASWLLLEYVRSHFGGNTFLTGLTHTTGFGIANLTGATGLDWSTLLHRWGVALWADDAGIPGVDPIYSYPELDLRTVFQESEAFPLIPAPLPWADFTRTGALPSAASKYWLIDAGPNPTALSLGVSGRHTPHTPSDQPQLSVLRIQ